MLFDVDEEQFVKKCRFCTHVTDNFSSLIKHEATHSVIVKVEPIASTSGEDVPNNVLNNQNQIFNGDIGDQCQDLDVKVKIENQSQDESMKVYENNHLDSDDDGGGSELEFDEELQEEFKEYLEYCFSQNKINNIRRGRGRGRGKGRGRGRGRGKKRLMINKNFRLQNIKRKYSQNQTNNKFDFYELDKEVNQMIRGYKWENDAKRVEENGEPFLECLTCAKRFKGVNKNGFFHHYQAAHTTTGHQLYACLYCNLTFSQPSSRLRHASIRHQDKKIQKDIIPIMPKLSRQTVYVPKYDHQIQERQDEILLNERIRNYVNWENDAKRIKIDGKFVFQCLLCSKNISSKVSLFNHMMTHTGELPLKCYYCPMQFRRADNRRLHEMRSHPNKVTKIEQLHNSEEILDCPKLEFNECIIPDIGSSNQKSISTVSKKFFKTKFTLEKPNEEQIKLYNKICRKNSRKDEKLLKERMHSYNWEIDGIKINIPEYEYQCNKCPQNLKSKAALFYHTQTHDTMLKTLKCFFCSLYFGRSDHRSQHEMKHMMGSKSQSLKKSIKKPQKYNVSTTTTTTTTNSSKLKNKAKANNIPRKKLTIKQEKSESEPNNGPQGNESRRDDENILLERIRAYDWSLDGKMVDIDHEEGKRQKAFQCLNCDSILSSKVALFNHSFKHNALERPLKCSLCSSTFIQPILRKAHEFRIHGIGTNPNRKTTKPDKSDRKSINSTDQMDNELDESLSKPILEEPLNLSNSTTDQMGNELDNASNKPIVEEPLNLSLKDSHITENEGNSNSNVKTDFEDDNISVKKSKKTKTKREDELLFIELVKNYNWENDGKKIKVEKDGKIIDLFECFKCQAQIKVKREFFNHNLIHSQLNIFKFKCQFCDKSFGKIWSRNVHENSHIVKNEKMAKVKNVKTKAENVKKLTKKPTNVKRPAKIRKIESSIDIHSLNDIIDGINNEYRNSNEMLEKKFSNDNDNEMMESGNASTDILSQFSDFVLESENRKEMSIVGVENIGDIDMEDSESKSENVLTNDSFVQPVPIQPIKELCDEKPILKSDSESESDEEMSEQREDELKYSEDLKNYDWEKEKDGKRIGKSSIQCLSCKKSYQNKRDFYNHMLAAHWKILLFKCNFCERFFGQIQTRRTHEGNYHTKAEKKLLLRTNRIKRRKISENDQVNVKIEENSDSFNNLGTSLLDESNVVNAMVLEDQSVNQEKVADKSDKNVNVNSNDSKKNKRKSETKNSAKSKPKYNLKNVEKCYVVCPTTDEQKTKMHQCKKCFEILRGASKTELLDHVHSHSHSQ